MNPSAVFSSQLAVAPGAVWAQLLEGDFVARYLGVAADAIAVTAASAPAALSVRVQAAGGAAQDVHWTITPCGGGSRLTVVHEHAAAPAAAAAAADSVGLLLRAAVSAPLDYLRGSASAVRALAAALPARQGYTRPAAGGFSLAEHLWHLADVEELGWAPRFERVLHEDRPRLPGVDGDRLAVERQYQHQPWRGAARRFVAQRKRTLLALARLGPAGLARQVVFAGRRCAASEVLAAMLAHDREHRLEMADLWTTWMESSR